MKKIIIMFMALLMLGTVGCSETQEEAEDRRERQWFEDLDRGRAERKKAEAQRKLKEAQMKWHEKTLSPNSIREAFHDYAIRDMFGSDAKKYCLADRCTTFTSMFIPNCNIHPNGDEMPEEFEKRLEKKRMKLQKWVYGQDEPLRKLWYTIPKEEWTVEKIKAVIRPLCQEYDQIVLEGLEELKDFYSPCYESIAVRNLREGYWDKH